jgi:Icc-related predicted phosphoesterase
LIIRVAHCSDTHEHPSIIRQVADHDVDLIILTGDIIKNKGRIDNRGIYAPRERGYQRAWCRKHAKKWAKDFGDTPVVYVDGNHDFIDVGKWLSHYGCVNLHHITAETPCVEVCGLRFAGFRDIPWIEGEWEGEAHDLRIPVERAFACDPDVLVTHGPPAGILDGPYGYGITQLASALAWQPHRITHHFFGHVHETGGQVVEEMGIKFINGAGYCRVHNIEVKDESR